MVNRLALLVFVSAVMLSAGAQAGLLDALQQQLDKVNNDGSVQQHGNFIVVERGDNHVEFDRVNDMHGDYRVFGINFNSQTGTPVGYVDAFVPMISLERDRQLYRESGPLECEKEATKEMRIVSVIFANSAVRGKFMSWQEKPKEHGHFAVNITGVIMRKTKDLYKGQSMEGMTTSNPQFSIDNVLLVTDANTVAW